MDFMEIGYLTVRDGNELLSVISVFIIYKKNQRDAAWQYVYL